MASNYKTCVLCDGAANTTFAPSTLATEYECDRCGRYLVDITQSLMGTVNDLDDKYLISGFTRSQFESKSPPSMLTESLFEQIRSAAPLTIWEKSNLLLRHVESRSKYFGDQIAFKPEIDYPLAYAKNAHEFLSLIRMQDESRFIKLSATNAAGVQVVLTADGVRELETVRRTNAESEKVFVAMWFDAQVRAIYDNHIKPAIFDAGYKAVRIDLEEFNDDVIARVLTEIREAKFVVADFTGHRNGVYFEAGFAKGLGLDVIWLCRDNEIDNAHFDTNHFNHMVWNPADDLRTKLCSRILATIGPGPLKTPTEVK